MAKLSKWLGEDTMGEDDVEVCIPKFKLEEALWTQDHSHEHGHEVMPSAKAGNFSRHVRKE